MDMRNAHQDLFHSLHYLSLTRPQINKQNISTSMAKLPWCNMLPSTLAPAHRHPSVFGCGGHILDLHPSNLKRLLKYGGNCKTLNQKMGSWCLPSGLTDDGTSSIQEPLPSSTSPMSAHDLCTGLLPRTALHLHHT